MNPNTRKRHDSLPKCDHKARDTRNPGEPRTKAQRKADKNRLFNPKNTTKESDNMTLRKTNTYRTYRDITSTIRIPTNRMMEPRLVVGRDTIAITRGRAAELLRTMWRSRTPKAELTAATDTSHASRMWVAWMQTDRKITFAQYCIS